MSSIFGKTVEANFSENEVIGSNLKRLRVLAGVTQKDLASTLGIGQTALSKLENRHDVQVSTLRDYIEALGAKLKIGAEVTTSSPLGRRVLDAFELDGGNDDQLLFSIFGDEEFRPARDVVLSIKPQYSDPIITGHKTVELRRRFPVNVPKGTIAYIYSTTPTRAIIGHAEISGVFKKTVNQIWNDHSQTAHIARNDFDAYFEEVEHGFVVCFQNAQPLERKIELNELRERYDFIPPQSFLYAKPLLRNALKNERTSVSH